MTADLSIRPTAPAELPSLAHVTNHEDRSKRESLQQERKRQKRSHAPQPGDDPASSPVASGDSDDSTSTIDLLA